MAICKAMLETGIRADFIVIDGKEGGTGASPLEFADHVGTPLREGLLFAHNTLVGCGLRETIRLGASAGDAMLEQLCLDPNAAVSSRARRRLEELEGG